MIVISIIIRRGCFFTPCGGEVLMTTIGESDLEETEIGVSRDILEFLVAFTTKIFTKSACLFEEVSRKSPDVAPCRTLNPMCHPKP